MPTSHAKIAEILAIFDQATGDGKSLRFIAASVAMHGLLSAGAAEKHGAAKCASVAYDVADAFIEETVMRLLPAANGGST